MSKYSFERLGSDRFEQLSQTLLEKPFRVAGKLVQFGAGKDGAREATWTQMQDHPTYNRPRNANSDVPKDWVFQAKYHDIGTRGWAGARAEVEAELDKELDKIVNKYKVACHKYVLITNVPFSGARNVGTRDKVNKVIEKWHDKIPEIEVWDAVDLSRMLDADPDTRTTYLDDILPGDVLRAFLSNANFRADRRRSALHAYLKSVLRSERDAKAEEAGDESGLQLEKIFVDLDLKLITDSPDDTTFPLIQDLRRLAPRGNRVVRHFSPDVCLVPSSFALLCAGHKSMLLKGGPGVGKSTITQFLTLYHAARLIDVPLAAKLGSRLKLLGMDLDRLDAHSRVRFPLRVELRRYAQWMSDSSRAPQDHFLARYLAERISHASSAELAMDDIFAFAGDNPILLILDGLDEVPHPDVRTTIFNELTRFLDRCEGESADIQLLLSSRPQGYRGEFDGFSPLEWHVVDLERTDFEDYVDRWLMERIPSDDERNDARRRIDHGMQAASVQQMAATLLQATVMLTIARRKHPIPHARHKLYEKYVEVIFERERNKQTVRERSDELLRLHELVGFKLIRTMELPTGLGTLRGEEFRQCVRQIIEDYGPTELGETSIREVVEDIITLAKDRLCLLAGKGDDQDDVDFAIQQFREYFAAAYLAHHEDADPERVYACLVDRPHIWAQVLQFYAAFQSKAQHKNWISEADGTGIDQGGYDGIVKLTRIRRSLLRVLPEFERPKNEYIQRAIHNLFATLTRWTWRDREDAARLLNAFAPDEAFGVLRHLFDPLTIDDPQSLNVELDLLARTATPLNKSAIRKIMEELLDDVRSSAIVVDIAYENDLDVDICECSIDIAERTLCYRPIFSAQERPMFLGPLSEDLVLDLIYHGQTGGSLAYQSNVAKEDWLQALNDCLTPSYVRVETRNVGCSFAPYLSDRRGRVSEEVIARVTQSRAQVAPYLAALLRAIESPFDHECYDEARVLQEEVKGEISEFLTVEFQLGPNPVGFSSLSEWAEWRNNTFVSSKSILDAWIGQILNDDISSIMLFVHPDAWPELTPFASVERLRVIMDECQSAVKSLSPHSVIPIEVFRYSFPHGYDSLQLCKFVVNLISKHGRRALWNSTIVETFVDVATIRAESVYANGVLSQALELQDTLPSFWGGVIARICSAVPDVDIDKLYSFWSRHWSDDWVWMSNIEKPQDTLVEQALMMTNGDAARFAAFLASNQTRQGESLLAIGLAVRVTRRLCRSILDSTSTRLDVDTELLLQQALDADELRVWSDARIVSMIRDSAWHIDRLGARLKEIVNTGSRFDQKRLRRELGVFVDHRAKFPFEIPLAALDALLRLDEITSTALDDSDWQRDKKTC